jgi:hypothetical protein
VVVGEPQRAFYGNQFGNTFPIFAHYRVPLWVPEVGGPIDPDNEAHDLIMSVFGGVSKGERNRIKIRVRTAMAAQAQLEGRFLGGRPPNGYKLIALGRIPIPLKPPMGRGSTPSPSTNYPPKGTVALCDIRAASKYELGARGQIASASSSKITPSLQRPGVSVAMS